MALTFASGKSLSIASALFTAPPMSFACWFFPTSFAATNIMTTIDDGSTTTNQFQVHVNASGLPRCTTADSTGGTAANGTVALTLNVWNHLCGSWGSATDRNIYLNGGNKANDVASRTPVSLSKTWIGANGAGMACAGAIAYAAWWNIKLADADVVNLAASIHPSKIRPANLVRVIDFVGASPEPDRWSSTTWTVNGSPTLSVNPFIFSRRGRSRLTGLMIKPDTFSINPKAILTLTDVIAGGGGPTLPPYDFWGGGITY